MGRRKAVKKLTFKGELQVGVHTYRFTRRTFNVADAMDDMVFNQLADVLGHATSYLDVDAVRVYPVRVKRKGRA